jgi:transitional endoplasmic reticulum ATPase
MSKVDPLREAVELSPENVPLRLLFAHACLDEFLFDEARASYEKVINLDKNHLEARLGVIRCLAQENKLSEAIVRLESLLAEPVTSAPARLLMSRLLACDGNLEDAKEHYLKATKLPQFTPDSGLEKQLFIERTPPNKPGNEGKTRLAATERGWEAEGDMEAGGFQDSKSDLGESKPEGIERPKINFSNIGGMESVKEEIRMKILYPLQNPELFRAYGKSIGGGVLLYGPPGCGKTMISRATAGEIQANFLSIGLHEILDLYIGESEKN